MAAYLIGNVLSERVFYVVKLRSYGSGNGDLGTIRSRTILEFNGNLKRSVCINTIRIADPFHRNRI